MAERARALHAALAGCEGSIGDNEVALDRACGVLGSRVSALRLVVWNPGLKKPLNPKP